MYEVSVSYFKKSEWQSYKSFQYPQEEAEKMYLRTTNKFTESKEEVIICMRDEKGEILKSDRLNIIVTVNSIKKGKPKKSKK